MAEVGIGMVLFAGFVTLFALAVSVGFSFWISPKVGLFIGLGAAGGIGLITLRHIDYVLLHTVTVPLSATSGPERTVYAGERFFYEFAYWGGPVAASMTAALSCALFFVMRLRRSAV